MILRVFFVLIFYVVAGQAVDQDVLDSDTTTLFKEGKLVSITLSLGNPIKIFVSQKEEARIDLSKMKLSVRRIRPYPGEELAVTRDGRVYTVVTPRAKLRELEITTTVNESRETFRFDVNNKK